MVTRVMKTRSGARIDILDNEGKTPLTLTKCLSRAEAEKLLHAAAVSENIRLKLQGPKVKSTNKESSVCALYPSANLALGTLLPVFRTPPE
jgi:hypothetical protein